MNARQPTTKCARRAGRLGGPPSVNGTMSCAGMKRISGLPKPVTDRGMLSVIENTFIRARLRAGRRYTRREFLPGAAVPVGLGVKARPHGSVSGAVCSVNWEPAA